MIEIRRSEDRGHANHGWLDTKHTFSFAGYRDPEHMGFSELRVLNDDRVAPGQGFGTHGHANMEILSYVLDGVLEHKDSMGTGSKIRPGDVQFMSAGSGVTHSEFNGSAEEEVHFLQMWVLPENEGTEPRYDQKALFDGPEDAGFRLAASPDGRQGSIRIGADVALYVGRLHANQEVEYELAPGRRAWIHVARGELTLNGLELDVGDGAAVADEGELRLRSVGGVELVLFDLP